MKSIGVAKQVINLFVHNPKQLLITKPKIIQICAEEIATKLRYAPLEGDVLSLSPQARKVAERIKELKSRILEVGQTKYTYEQYSGLFSSTPEDKILADWYEILKLMPLKTKDTRLEEINKCFQIENIKKIEFFKNLSNEEQNLLLTIDRKREMIPVLTGHKPAFDGSTKNGIINFSKAIKGTRFSDTHIAINNKIDPQRFFIINKEQLKKVIANNKEIYCGEMGLDINTPTNDVYNKWLQLLEKENTNNAPASLGLMLGYPKYSSIIFSLDQFIQKNEYLKTVCKKVNYSNEELRKRFLTAFYHSDSPYKNCSDTFKRDFEKYVQSEDLRNFMRDDEKFVCFDFIQHGSDTVSMNRIRQLDADFVNNFRIEQLF